MNDKSRILDKIRKCLALSASSNEHEAAAALRQAYKLMQMHGLSEQDVAAAEARECAAKAGVKQRPPLWETLLASQIAKGFGCQVFFASGYSRNAGEWRFIGCGEAAEVAQYAFEVLQRQARRAREAHIQAHLKRCRAHKTRRADLFSEGWVRAVAGKISEFCGTEQQAAVINAYLAVHYPTISDLKVSNRNKDRKIGLAEYQDYMAGKRSGEQAQLNRAMPAGEEQMALL